MVVRTEIIIIIIILGFGRVSPEKKIMLITVISVHSYCINPPLPVWWNCYRQCRRPGCCRW